MLTSLCLISSKQSVSSNQCLCYSTTGLKLSWSKTKLQNVSAGDPPSTILIDGVPVDSAGSTGMAGGGRSPPRLGPKKFIARPKNTHICKPPFACQNVLKLTYSNLEFQHFSGEGPPKPPLQEERREGEGRGGEVGKRAGKDREGRGGTGRDMGGKEVGRGGMGRGWWGGEGRST